MEIGRSLSFLLAALCLPLVPADANLRNLQARIIGGATASPSRFPYFTFLLIQTDLGTYQCGGTLVAKDMVLSAAHCITGLGQVQGITAWVNNTRNVASNPSWKTGYEYSRTVVEWIKNPLHSPSTNRNDALLLKLSKPVENVSPVILNRNNGIPTTGSQLSVFGFGVTTFPSSVVASELMVVDVNAVSYDDCNDRNSYNGLIRNSVMLCASASGRDSCSGDSGSGLVIKGSSPSNDVQVGIVSWGAGCAKTNKPGVYARVSGMMDWIESTICTYSVTTNCGSPNTPNIAPASSPSSQNSADKTFSSTVDMENPSSSLYCISGESLITVKDRGQTKMKHLKIGDQILVPGNKYEPVYSFGHYHKDMTADFLQFLPSKLEMTTRHMVHVEGKGFVPASMVRAGDVLMGGEAVSSIQTVTRKGVYAPFTPSGTLLVNGIHASSYIALAESTGFWGFSHQWLAHSFLFPHRIWCHYLGQCGTEEYNEEGLSKWMTGTLTKALSILTHDSMSYLLLIPLTLIVAMGALAELMPLYLTVIVVMSLRAISFRTQKSAANRRI